MGKEEEKVFSDSNTVVTDHMTGPTWAGTVRNLLYL